MSIIYPKVTTWGVFKQYWKPVKKYFLFGLITFVSISVAVLAQSVIVPTYYKKFFDVITQSGDVSLVASVLVHLITIIAVLNLVAWVGNRLSIFSIARFQVYVMTLARQNAYDYVLNHSYSFFLNNFTGSLVQKINRFTRAFERLSDRLLLDIVPLIIKIAGAGIVLFMIDKRIALIILLWILAFLVVSFVFNKIKLKYDIQGAAVDSKVAAALSDSIATHNVIQLFTGTKSESKRFSLVNMEFLKIYYLRWNLGAGIEALQMFLTITAEFFVFFYAIKYWEMGMVSIGTFALVQVYMVTIGGSLWGFGRIVRDFYEATADAKEMVEILHLPHEVKDHPEAIKLSVQTGAIEFKEVSFSFSENRPVFQKLNLKINPGEKVALIGPSGAGKSTLVKLLLRLHDLKGGEILIDGQNIQEATQESLRENISLVPQDPALFHRTLMENIRYGKRDATDEEVIRASQMAHCDVFIQEFPHKYNTYVGERGVKLSGGERQRVAIARALLKNAPILVLDEATSSLDSHSESLIQDALSTLMKGKTTIVIAHRLSTIRKMNRIIVLGKEGIIEEGSHEDLLKKADGMYARLWKIQAGGFVDKSIEELLED